MRTRVVLVALILSLLAVAGWGTFRWLYAAPDDQFVNLAAGDCVTLLEVPGVEAARDGTMTVRHEQVGCEPEPTPMVYTVGVVGKGTFACPSEDYVEYYQLSAGRTAGPSTRAYTSCLVPNFEPGLCYAEDATTLGYLAVPCGRDALMRVDAADTDIDLVCPKGDGKLVFPQPAYAFCIRPPE